MTVSGSSSDLAPEVDKGTNSAKQIVRLAFHDLRQARPHVWPLFGYLKVCDEPSSERLKKVYASIRYDLELLQPYINRRTAGLDRTERKPIHVLGEQWKEPYFTGYLDSAGLGLSTLFDSDPEIAEKICQRADFLYESYLIEQGKKATSPLLKE